MEINGHMEENTEKKPQSTNNKTERNSQIFFVFIRDVSLKNSDESDESYNFYVDLNQVTKVDVP